MKVQTVGKIREPLRENEKVANYLLHLKKKEEEERSIELKANRRHRRRHRFAKTDQLRELLAYSVAVGGVPLCPPPKSTWVGSCGIPSEKHENRQQEQQDPEISTLPWERLLGDDSSTNLVQMKDRGLVPDALFLAMAQMERTIFTEADRGGFYKKRTVGFAGLSCKHCGGQPGVNGSTSTSSHNNGRYFPNSVRNLAQTTTSQTILKHVGERCPSCPPIVKQAILDLQKHDLAVKEGKATKSHRQLFGIGGGRGFSGKDNNSQKTLSHAFLKKHLGPKNSLFCPSPHVRQALLELQQRELALKRANASGRPLYGSRKIFFQRVWARIHNTKPPKGEEEEEKKTTTTTLTTRHDVSCLIA